MICGHQMKYQILRPGDTILGISGIGLQITLGQQI